VVTLDNFLSDAEIDAIIRYDSLPRVHFWVAPGLRNANKPLRKEQTLVLFCHLLWWTGSVGCIIAVLPVCNLNSDVACPFSQHARALGAQHGHGADQRVRGDRSHPVHRPHELQQLVPRRVRERKSASCAPCLPQCVQLPAFQYRHHYGTRVSCFPVILLRIGNSSGLDVLLYYCMILKKYHVLYMW
jgi:hypothetical protein